MPTRNKCAISIVAIVSIASFISLYSINKVDLSLQNASSHSTKEGEHSLSLDSFTVALNIDIETAMRRVNLNIKKDNRHSRIRISKRILPSTYEKIRYSFEANGEKMSKEDSILFSTNESSYVVFVDSINFKELYRSISDVKSECGEIKIVGYQNGMLYPKVLGRHVIDTLKIYLNQNVGMIPILEKFGKEANGLNIKCM